MRRVVIRLAVITWVLIAATGWIGCGQRQEPADLVLRGGTIITVDADDPEAQAIAVRDGRIVEVGDEAQIRPLIGEGTKVIELAGAVATPGFIDSHAHLFSIGRAKMQLDLTTAKSWQEIVAMVAAAADEAEPGQWIFGRGWHQDKWSQPPEPNVAGLPLHHELSQVSAVNPVLLTHASGHAVLVNEQAMEMAGINAATPDPAGGEIVRDEAGNPIGALRESAKQLIGAVMDRTWDEATQRRKVELAGQACLANGVTSLHDAGSTTREVELLKTLAEEGALPIRLWVMLRVSNEELAEGLEAHIVRGVGDDHLTVGAIKRLADGALGSHGAWLLEPYADLPSSTGLSFVSPEELETTARLALEHNLQLCTHAIGDRANHEVLDVYERALAGSPDGGQRRWRVEHAQHLHPDDIGRFARLGVVAAMQPVHCTSDAPWVFRRLGPQRAREGAYVWRSLLDSGARIATGTDAPVEDLSPIATFYAAVSRRLADGSRFFPDQVMTREEALRAATLDAAYAAFEEEIKGSLEPGKLADITVLDRNILTVDEDDILGTRILYTIVGGEVRYQAPEVAPDR